MVFRSGRRHCYGSAGCDGEGFHAGGGLCRDHVHDGAQVGILATGTYRPTRCRINARKRARLQPDRCGTRAGTWGSGQQRPGAAHGFFDGGTHFRIGVVDGGLHGFHRHAQVLRTNMVEFLREVTQGPQHRGPCHRQGWAARSVASLVPISARGIASISAWVSSCQLAVNDSHIVFFAHNAPW